MIPMMSFAGLAAGAAPADAIVMADTLWTPVVWVALSVDRKSVV